MLGKFDWFFKKSQSFVLFHVFSAKLQLYLAWRNSTINIGYSHHMPCYLNRKCNLLYSYENYECHYWLQTCSFSDWSYLYIILHLAPALTCLSSSISSIPLPQLCDWYMKFLSTHSCLTTCYKLFCCDGIVFVN